MRLDEALNKAKLKLSIGFAKRKNRGWMPRESPYDK